MAEEPVWPPGRDHAKNHADDKRENLCRENKQQRRRKTLGDQACHRRVEEEAVAEIQPDNIAKIESKLHQKGLVEAVISPDLCHHLFGGAAHVTGNGVGDITRRDMDQREIENNDGQQQRHRVGCPYGHLLEKCHRCICSRKNCSGCPRAAGTARRRIMKAISNRPCQAATPSPRFRPAGCRPCPRRWCDREARRCDRPAHPRQ